MAGRVVHSLAELSKPQIQAVLDKVVINATGTCTPPPLDLDAIRTRADELDPSSQTKADIYRLLFEVERLQKEST